jgi:hypothetical protein
MSKKKRDCQKWRPKNQWLQIAIGLLGKKIDVYSIIMI